MEDAFWIIKPSCCHSLYSNATLDFGTVRFTFLTIALFACLFSVCFLFLISIPDGQRLIPSLLRPMSETTEKAVHCRQLPAVLFLLT